jgi:chorismate mutase
MNARTISEIRNQFEEIDKEIVILLAKRTSLSKEIALIKKTNKENVVQPEVWNLQLKRRLEENKILHMDPNFLKQIFNSIHAESVRIQNQELEDNK